jgi:adenine-specific DNA-methyltransferase
VKQRLSGRLELTWTNKDLRLLAHEHGSYEWVPPADYRVAEVRLLHDAGTVGQTHPERARAKDNLLIRGDALAGLHSLVQLPEFSKELLGNVRLAYLDPPFNTGQAFEHYDDALEHSVWLTMMRDRLRQIQELLHPETGSVWVHLDDTEVHRCRVLMDEIFQPSNYVATIIWQKSHTRENRTDISTTHEYLLVYTMNHSAWKKARNLLPSSDEQIARYQNPDSDSRGPWSSLPAHAKAEKGRRKEQFFAVTLPSGRVVEPPKGRCWLFTGARWEEMVADNRIWFGEDGDNVPRLKKFLSEVQEGLVPVTLWPHKEVGTTGTAKAEIVALFPDETPFSTPKPEALLRRIIQIGSNPGEIVLDCFAGSGTTAAVAHKMDRRWITSEWSRETLETFTLPRLEKVVSGDDQSGVSESLDWTGGGGFRVLDVAASMFDEDEGLVVLADWAIGGALAEATAAQLGFAYAEDQPFVGRKGRMRLAVIDGLVSRAVVELLLAALPETERLTICGTTIDDEAGELLRTRRRGSRVRKIPASILAEYQQTHRWRPALAAAAGQERDAMGIQPSGDGATAARSRSKAKALK